MTLAHRIARPDDLPHIVEIYNSTVASRMVTADIEPVPVESRRHWFEQHNAQTRPLWVAGHNEQIEGWLSLSDFYGRPAYWRTAEVSVYVRAASRRSGVASYLMTSRLFRTSERGLATLRVSAFRHVHDLPLLTQNTERRGALVLSLIHI